MLEGSIPVRPNRFRQLACMPYGPSPGSGKALQLQPLANVERLGGSHRTRASALSFLKYEWPRPNKLTRWRKNGQLRH